MLSGLGLMMGNIGALFAQVPLRLLVEQFGWRAVALGSAACVLAIGAAAWALVANDPFDNGFRELRAERAAARRTLTIGRLLREFPTIFTYRNTWLIFLAQGGFVGAMLSFTGLWGPAYLQQRFALASTEASAVCSVMIVCWAVASPLAGHLSDTIGRRKPIYLGGAVVAAAGWSTMFYAPLPLAAFTVVAAVTSFACGAVVVALRLREGVGAGAVPRHDLRRGQRRQHARADVPAAGDRLGAGSAVVRRDGRRRPRLLGRRVSGRVRHDRRAGLCCRACSSRFTERHRLPQAA